ncbi:MAG: hypothetical protein ACI8UR_000950 [Natronomonas sp.]|jgi:hypothetical protein
MGVFDTIRQVLGWGAETDAARAADPDEQTEFKLESVLDGELTVEDDTTYWYPMWPEGDTHPWVELSPPF